MHCKYITCTDINMLHNKLMPFLSSWSGGVSLRCMWGVELRLLGKLSPPSSSSIFIIGFTTLSRPFALWGRATVNEPLDCVEGGYDKIIMATVPLTSKLKLVMSLVELLLWELKERRLLKAALMLVMACTVLERLSVSLRCLWAASWRPMAFRNALRTYTGRGDVVNF